MNMPGFIAEVSLYSSTRSYRARVSGIPSAMSSSVMPQIGIGGSGGFGRIGRLGLDPLPDSCSRCEYICTVVSCGPNCREERCADVCQSIPCGSSQAV